MRHPVHESPLPGWIDPAGLAGVLFAGRSSAVWLDSGIHAAEGMSCLGFGSRTLSASVADNTITVDGETRHGRVLDFLREDLAGAEGLDGSGPLGWVGWLGYGLHAQTMGVASAHRPRYADASLLFVDLAIVFDHAAQAISVIGLDLAAVEDMRARAIGAFAPAAPAAGAASLPRAEAVWADSDEEYLGMIGECQAAIEAGDAYQLCLTTEVRVAVTPEPFAAYLALRSASPSHHGAYFRAGAVALLSSSPEVFLTVTPDGTIESQPIKGTRPRGDTAESDAALMAELLGSEKERAENLMIVDLMRNDIGRVSEVGSVTVPRLLAVESYAHVHQLVSTVRGRLAAGLTGVDAVRACFPAGSMTGAPKHSAVRILDRLEHRARGVYAGAFGYFGLDGRIELSMVIRSILLDADGASIGTGGGITALSVPIEELAEVKLKSAVLLAVLGVVPSP
ncbi:anthranilate synthase component I family protein [Lacisediminihabitans sp. FW035]